jgi:hypothetical protein
VGADADAGGAERSVFHGSSRWFGQVESRSAK